MKHLRILITAMLIAWFAQVDAQTPISALPTLTAPDSSADWIPIVHSGTTYKVTPGKLFFEFGGAGGGSTPWYLDGNTVGSEKWLGTVDNYALPFRTNNTERARFDVSGNLMIGLSASPLARLHVKGSGTTSSTLNFYAQNSSNSRSIAHYDNGVIYRDGGLYSIINTTSTSWGSGAGSAANGLNTASVFIGYFAGANSTNSRVIAITGDGNNPSSANYGTGSVAVGNGAIIGATGGFNAGYGTGAGSRTTSGNSNLYLGSYADIEDGSTTRSNITGDYNIILGSIVSGGSAGTSFTGGNAFSSVFAVHGIGTGSNQIVFGGGSSNTYFTSLRVGYSSTAIHGTYYRTSTPESAQAASRGSIAFVDDGADGKAYIKASGTGNTGWLELSTGSSSGTVSSIATTSPITGGTITTTGTIGIDNAAADGSTKGAASFTAADFNSSTGLISLDYTNGQAASGSTKGFLTSADWTTFNGKQAAGSYLTADGAVVGALSQLQAFTSGIGTGLIDDNGAGEFLINVTGADRLGVYTTGLQTVSGSAASPSYSFFADNTSGLYLKTANTEIGASVNGALVGGFNTAGLFANIISEMSAANGVTIDGVNLKDGLVVGQYGGTGVNNSGKTITLGGNLETSGANNVTFTTSGATNVTLPTSGTLVNSAVTTLSSLASIGTVTTGTWNASVLAGQYGGTGVANTGKTLTLSGNTTIGSSTHTVDFATGANTSVTLPASGTLATLAGTETFTNKSIVGTQLTGTAYTFAANNTNATAAYTLQRYEDHDLATYSGTVDFNGTDPSSITSQQYAWSRVGNTVTLFFSIFYGTPGTTNTSATFTMPSDLPAPATFATGGDAASEYIFPISGARVEANMTANPSAVRGGLRRNAANDGYEVLLIFGSVSAAHVSFTLSYRTQ